MIGRREWTFGKSVADRFFNDPLYRNSLFLVGNRALVVLTGFAFWIVATRLYAVDAVGLAVAFVSSAQLIGAFALGGFDVSIVRFFNSYDRSRIFSTALLLVTAFSLVAGVIYIAGVQYFSPDLAIIREPVYAVIFLLFTVGLTLSIVTSQTFVALRDAKYSFIQNLILTLRIPLLLPVAFLGSLGILGATFVAYLVAYPATFYFLRKFFPLRPGIDRDFIRRSYRFSFGNYLANLIQNATYSVLPLVVLNVLGAADAGLYYIGFTVGYFALQIPAALGMSFFVEGVYGESLRKTLLKIGRMAFGILSAAVAVFLLFGDPIMALFGSEYVAATGLMRLIAISSFLYAAYVFFTMILNIKMRIQRLILLNAAIFILVVGLSYLLLGPFGITGVGYAFIAVYALVDAYILYLVRKWKWL